MIFLPYAIPAVIGAIMWGFLYSKNFGPCPSARSSGSSGTVPPDLLSKQLIFFGLLNVVTWQWAGYYMIILYAALQGIDPTLYEAARIDGANTWQITLRIKVPLPIANALVLILVFALIGTLQFFNEPQVLQVPGRRLDRAGLHAQHVRLPARPSRSRTSTTARRSRSRSASSSSSRSTSSCSQRASEGASSHDHSKY